MKNDLKNINRFYRDYKKLNTFINEELDISKAEVSKIINYEIVKKFIETDKNHSVNLLSLLNFEKPDEKIDYTKYFSEIEKVVNKYNWSLENNVENALTPDIIGKVFEKYINQRENGAYYTDDDTINYILDKTIIPNVLNNLNPDNNLKIIMNEKYIKESINSSSIILEKFMDNLKYASYDDTIEFIEKLKATKIMDISVGTGAFLINCFDYLIEIFVRAYKNINKELPIKEIIDSIITKNLYGIDIMSDSVNIAKFRMILKSIQISKKFDYEYTTVTDLEIHVGNSLVDDITKLIPAIDENNGVDIIIGNPPYIEYSKIKSYSINNYETIASGNTYAFMIEKSLKLMKPESTIGVIVPISVVSTKRMRTLRNLLSSKCEILWFANFADRPGTLFNGVHQKLTIILGKKSDNNNNEIFTTSYNHWYEKDRNELFKNIKFISNNHVSNDFIMKYGNDIEKNIINKIYNNKESIESLKHDNGNYKLYVSTRMTFWIKAFLLEQESKEYKKMYFANEKNKYLYYLIINSDIFYFYWEVISDCWHITKKEFANFKINTNEIEYLDSNKIIDLAKKLEKSIETNKEYIGSKQVEYVYKHKKSKLIIDEINEFITPIFNLTNEEINYIKNYNIIYRMNDEYEKYVNNVRKGYIYECD